MLQYNGLIGETIPLVINDQTNAMLTNIPYDLEIHSAVKSLNSDSTPDDFRAFFYQHHWDVIQTDAIKAISQFFLQD